MNRLNWIGRGRGACVLVITGAALLANCSKAAKSADVNDKVRAAISQAGLADVKTDQDRDKGVVTLTGHVAAEADKAQAESVAQAAAGDQVISNQIAVVPPGGEEASRKVNSALDKGIESNLEAALVGEKLSDVVHYSVNNHVVTLSGKVDSQAIRTRANTIAEGILNVQQVVNELQVKSQKATTN